MNWIRAMIAAALMQGLTGTAAVQAASKVCAAPASPMARAICADAELSALDARLASTLESIAAKVGPNERAALSRGQRDWLRSRDACTGSGDMKTCAKTAYRSRIAQLEIEAGLVPAKGPIAFGCGEGQTAWVTFAQGLPPAARLLSSDYDLMLFGGEERPARGDEKVFENNGFTLVTSGGLMLLAGQEGALLCRVDH
ncbi:MAG: lysozyme inhibitor LprI family protein [Pseudomonadota bacterium]|nr:lysozyme inhibitor LprI family protein [Pseudomonadota bacterium]